MAIVRCPTCGGRLELDDRHLGQEVECGDCRAVFLARAERAARREVVEDDDRDDDYDDRPRRRSRRGADPSEVRGRLLGPAIGMIAGAVCGILWRVGDLVITLNMGKELFEKNLITGKPNTPDEQELFMNIAIISDVVVSVLAVVVIAGCLRMLQVRSHALAMTVAVASAIPFPCTGCCLIQMPFAIWGIVVLMDPAVKRAFEANDRL